MDWQRHIDETLGAAKCAYVELRNLIVWANDNGGIGTFYRSRYELIFAFKNRTAPIAISVIAAPSPSQIIP
jgi:hypothetical protein